MSKGKRKISVTGKHLEKLLEHGEVRVSGVLLDLDVNYDEDERVFRACRSQINDILRDIRGEDVDDEEDEYDDDDDDEDFDEDDVVDPEDHELPDIYDEDEDAEDED